MGSDDASKVYGGQVAAIISAQPRESTWQPATPVELFVTQTRTISSVAELAPAEQQQLACMWQGEDLEKVLRDGQDDMPIDLEVALVVDEQGTARYRLYGWNFGVVYLMDATQLECLAFASQHDLEHWHADQRDLFWAMDRAMQRNDHGFKQPMKFCWWDDSCWAKIADKPRGTVHSEPYIRQQFAGKN